MVTIFVVSKELVGVPETFMGVAVWEGHNAVAVHVAFFEFASIACTVDEGHGASAVKGFSSKT